MKTIEFLRLREFTKGPGGGVINGARRHMITKDGTEISIQRGRDIHSRPKIPPRTMIGKAVVNPGIGPFDYPDYHDQQVESVELGLYGNKDLNENHPLMRYCDDPEEYLTDPTNEDRMYTFAYVPLALVDRFIREHGGFDHVRE
ncbi:MAG: hypothetical protein HDQ88_06885 [Clostridia bacterium]|nr:hypothetical protein [Clostridia bacterium]